MKEIQMQEICEKVKESGVASVNDFLNSEQFKLANNILKNFEQTVYPNRQLDDYSYIDLRVEEQVIVKEKYRKG